MPTSSWNCFPDLGTGMDCPTASGSGKPASRQTDPDKTFRVGLIYGPSGCGKSSLVKSGAIAPAGEARPSGLHRGDPGGDGNPAAERAAEGVSRTCHRGLGLVDSLVAIRTGRVLGSGQKVLLVLDQFEQWLHAKRGEENTELVAALRQCDGEHVQAVVLVRDDFWLAASRFMADLEIELIQGKNTALVDLFDPRHARKVLMAFGTAYGNLPERTGDISRDQHAFLDQAITDLAQDGKVISVRLALFAEMVKGKPWTPATLRGGRRHRGRGRHIPGRDVQFPAGKSEASPPPESRSSGPQSPAARNRHRHQGADAVGSGIARRIGYADRPRDFADLIHILDNELRLITPTDPKPFSSEGQPTTSPGGRYYQLTHDYLVHSLRDWLTRKQRETRRGRAELRLAERSSVVECQAREPPLAISIGVGEHPCS